jgi:phosphoribosylaminoimidazole-succinocarboxamide synthase
MEKLEQLYEGKAKKVYRTSDEQVYWIEYKDSATAFNGIKKDTIAGKGFYNNQISAILFQYLETQGIPTHFEKLVNEVEMLVKAVEILPLEVIARNIAAGSLAKRLGLEEGTVLKHPVLEICYKSDELGDPMINDDHIFALELCTPEELDKVKALARKINELMKVYFLEKDITLVDFKLEFGRFKGDIILADEISPDTCRFWDIKTQEKLDKDRFRRDLGKVIEAYHEVYTRICD